MFKLVLLVCVLTLNVGLSRQGCTTNADCGAGMCCSQYGWCGSGPAYCGNSTPSPVTTTTQSSATGGGSCKCPPGQCCSKWGYCGSGPDYCGSNTAATTTSNNAGTTTPYTGPPTTAPSNSYTITQSEFQTAVTSQGYPMPSVSQYNSFVSQVQSVGKINTKREAAMFFSEIIWESGGLQYKKELACLSDGCPNAYPITPGIGVAGQTYCGRGYIQLTWDYNYKACSQALYGDNRLLTNSEQVATDEQVAWATAFWFWRTNVGILPAVQQGQFGAATNAINGGLECRGSYQNIAQKRFVVFSNVLKVWGITETPNEHGCYN